MPNKKGVLNLKKCAKKLVIFILLASCLIFSSQIIYASNDTENIESIIYDYFDIKLKSLQQGEVIDFSHLFNLEDKKSEDTYNFEHSLLEYEIKADEFLGNHLDRYELELDFRNIEFEENLVYAEVREEKTYYYQKTGSRAHKLVEYHILTLTAEDDRIYIIEDESDNEAILDEHGNKIDFSEQIRNMEAEAKKAEMMYQENQQPEEPITRDVPGDYYISYDRYAAVDYALSHTSNNSDATDYNPNFKCFANSSFTAGDCQNFASQCVWAGYGGSDTEDDINNHELPMTDAWWCDNQGAVTKWTSCSAFHNYITGNTYGPRGTDIAYRAANEGDIIHYSGGHVYVITKISDDDGDGVVDWDEIYVSAHTKNRLNSQLNTIPGYNSPTSSLKFVRINSFKWNDGN
ncbi:MAG TPA: hypothetical protein DHV55_06080 [Clostridiaceae bacterium]|nr:hypothetical protein [Clostridiaceae bacterium]